MKLLADWRKILRHAWSIRLLVVAALLSGIEVALPFFEDFVPRGTFAAISLIVTAAAFPARILSQKEFLSDETDKS